jgi:two-component system, cell cycle response regulator
LARILIIEDQSATWQLMTYLLRVAGHTVDVATDGDSGLAAARKLPPDLVLCDIQLPGMGGVEIVTQIRGDHRLHDIRVIAVTGLTLPGTRESLLASGFDGYVEKPIDPKGFVRDVEGFLNAKRKG